MVLDDGWELPLLETVSLTEEELLLLDWVMCSGSGLIPNAPLEDLVTNWADFRHDVLKCISELERKRQKQATQLYQNTAVLVIDDFLCRTLLAIVPTTFRWGTGADCGLDLKLKLYRFLSKEVDPDASNTEDEADSSTENESESSTGSTT